jgi:hypothetical protein
MMTNAFDAIYKAVGRLLQLIGGIIGAIWLIALFVSAIGLSTLTLSAIQLRDRLVEDGRGEISFNELEGVYQAHEAALERRKSLAGKKATEIEAKQFILLDEIARLAVQTADASHKDEDLAQAN